MRFGEEASGCNERGSKGDQEDLFWWSSGENRQVLREEGEEKIRRGG